MLASLLHVHWLARGEGRSLGAPPTLTLKDPVSSSSRPATGQQHQCELQHHGWFDGYLRSYISFQPINSHPTPFPRLDTPRWHQKRTNAGPTWVSPSDRAATWLRPQLTATSAVIPYQEPLSKGDNPELSSTLSQTLPMAAIFMRNRYIGWYVTSTSLHSMPRHLDLDHRLRKEQPHTQWRLTLFD